MLRTFMFGYWGWGASTEALLEASAAVEEARGFAPPCFVNVRVSRGVRAVGFRERAFETLAGARRYVWMPALGNERIVERASGIEIVDPAAAEGLLELVVERAAREQRVIFYCACEWPGTSRAPTCHRRLVGDLLARAAGRRKSPLSVEEWPGGPPGRLAIDGPPPRRGAASLKADLPLAALAGLPWGSAVVAGGVSFVSGPARPSRGALVLPVFADDALAGKGVLR